MSGEMSAEQPCESYRDVLVRVAVEGVAPSEEVKRHVASCAGCRGYVGSLGLAIDQLVERVPLVAPPAALKEQVMRRLREEGLRTAARAPEWRPRWWLAPWAAVAVVAVASAFLIGTGERRTPGRAQIEELSARIDALMSEVAALKRGGPTGASQRPIIVSLSSGAAVSAERGAADARGMAMVFPEANGFYMYVVAQHLPPLEAGEEYRVWLRRGEERASVGTLLADAAGRGELIYWGSAAFQYDAIGVTIETGDGPEPQPGARVLGGALGPASGRSL